MPVAYCVVVVVVIVIVVIIIIALVLDAVKTDANRLAPPTANSSIEQQQLQLDS